MGEKPSSEAQVQARMLAFEERFSFQERRLEEFHEVLLGQRREIDQLARRVARCEAAIDELRLGGDDLPHEKPPHY
ncbi:MAG: SlyX family protein [Planctomycetales bacterium]|nr:SlyX family protein [Planctomycetales bacterium]